MEASGPGAPPSIVLSVRNALYRMMRKPIHASARRWRIAGCRSAPLARASPMTRRSSRSNPSCTPRVATPRSKPSRPIATRQPPFTSPTTSARAAHHAHACGSRGAHVLLVEDHLLRQRGAPPAVLLGPAQTGPSRASEHTLPLAPQLDALVLVARSAPALDRGEVSDVVLGQPIADLTPKGLVLVAEAEVHGCPT